jgi:glycosyltransferase involved in cell wall biosynthesis
MGTGQAGVNLWGYLRDESGWGAAGRGYARALSTLQIPLALYDLSALSSNRSEDHSLPPGDGDQLHAVNLVCVDPGQHFAALAHMGERRFEGRYNIGAWAWELPRFPGRWHDRLAYYDELWVTTSFVADALTPISPVPVVRIPPVLTPRGLGSRERGRHRLGVSAEDFVFLFIFDFHSHLARKNPLALVRAFRAAFRPTEPARLVIKCANGGADRAGLAALTELASGHAIEIHDGYWPAAAMRDLLAACDAYASLHRSEGTGLTISDAMALGKPVIATGWSGNMDFMTVANSYPVRYEPVTLEESVGPYAAGEQWAEPSVEHAAALLRHVYVRREEAQACGAHARRDIETRFSEEAVAALIRSRLDVIAHRHDIAAFRREMRAYREAYHGLAQQVRGIVREALPPAATVLVVSKGDAALLELDGRRAWHFPCAEDGTYAGYYPAKSVDAIEHLETLRGKGGEFLLFPGTAFWWLDHYAGLRDHLDANYRRVWSDARCIIYRLSGMGRSDGSSDMAVEPVAVGWSA